MIESDTWYLLKRALGTAADKYFRLMIKPLWVEGMPAVYVVKTCCHNVNDRGIGTPYFHVKGTPSVGW